MPLEQISQASADQRKGRCGRVAPGICYRIYDETEFERAPRYTEPELRRTNLASVLLQTKFYRLGDIREFPFIEPPDEQSIVQAERLLEELGAIRADKLTSLGRQMARMPIDPRFARILIEAAHRNALREALIVVAALSAQDPRLRPFNHREAADTAQERFADDKSDFQALVNLWYWARRERQNQSSSGFKNLLDRHFISPSRYFEWRSLHRQLTGYCQRLGFKLNPKPSSYKNLHSAILTGSLGLIGFREDKRQYAGVHELRFQLLPGTRLAKVAPKWVVAAEIVETGQVYARTVAAIERQWLEKVAERLLKVSFFDEYWDEKRGEAMILSRATLYGLPVYDRRPIRLAPQDPAKAQEIFVQNVLVEPRQTRPWTFLRHNRQLLAKLLKLQAQERRTDIVVTPRVHGSFYLERLPSTVVNLATFEAWHDSASGKELERLRMQTSDLLRQADEDLTNVAFPGELTIGEQVFRLSYRFAPGDTADGVSLRVKADSLKYVSQDAIQWLVPGRFAEKLTELLKNLPKQYRRRLVPIPDRVADLCNYLLRPSRYRVGNLYEVLTRTLQDFYRVDVPFELWDETKLSPFLRMNVQWVNRRGALLDQDRDLKALKQRHEVELADALTQNNPLEIKADDKLAEFPTGEFQTIRRLRQGHTDFTVFPALVDKGEHVVLEMATNEAQQTIWHARGVCRLFLLADRQSARYVRKEYQKETTLHMHLAKLAEPDVLLDDLLMSIARTVYLQDKPIPASKEDFDARLKACRGEFVTEGLRSIELCCEIAAKRFEVSLAMERVDSAVFAPAIADMKAQLANLVPVDFMWQTPADRVKDLLRYLDAMLYRAGHLQGRVTKDQELMETAQGWEQRLQTMFVQAGEVPDLVAARYLLRELRVALFHQKLGTREKVSQKKLNQRFEELERVYAVN